jgi:2-dehydropantoate 2-reductase
MPKILVIGAGAIGSFYGGKLAQSGETVAVLSKHQEFFIQSPLGDFTFTPSPYNFEPDFVLICTKVYPDIDWKTLLSPHIFKHTAIVLLQNGIDIEPPIQTLFPHNEFISGLAFVCVHRETPTHIIHEEHGRLVFGNYPSGISPKVKQLSEDFEKAGISCKATENVKEARWRKLVWNAAFNPLSVLCGGASTTEMLNHPPTVLTTRHIMEEVVMLAKADGANLPLDCIDKNIEDTAKMPPYKTSMLLDFEHKRPMEVEAILGNALRVGSRLTVKTPYLETLYATLSLLNKKRQQA